METTVKDYIDTQIEEGNKEEVWKAIESYKAVQIKLMAEGWKHSFDWEQQVARSEKQPEGAERWKGHALKAWKCYNDCLKELGLPQQSVPGI